MGAGKSLARPGRKQATAIKLCIYSTYPRRSSTHFLDRCSNLCKPLKQKKKSIICPSNQITGAAMIPVPDEKWRLFNCFSVQRTSGSAPGPDPENRVCDQDTGSQGRPISCGMQVQGEPGHCRARTNLLEHSLRSFFFKISFICTS